MCRLKYMEGCRPGEGEILIKGRNIFMGYLKMPEKTMETVSLKYTHMINILLYFSISHFVKCFSFISSIIFSLRGATLAVAL